MADRRMLAQLDHLLRPLRNRLANVLARAVVQLVDDAKTLQSLQTGVLSGEDRDDCERFQNFGFSGVPLAGAEAVILFPNGDRGRPLVVAVDDRRYRPRGKTAGTVTVYNHTGASVTITPLGDIVATPGLGRQVLLGSTGASEPPAFNADLEELRGAIAGAANGNAIPALVGALGPYTGADKVQVE